MKLFVRLVAVVGFVLVASMVSAEHCRTIEPKGWGFDGPTCVPIRRGAQVIRVGETFFVESVTGEGIELRLAAVVGYSAFIEVTRFHHQGSTRESSTAISVELKPGLPNTSQATFGTLSRPLLVRVTGAPIGNEVPMIIN